MRIDWEVTVDLVAGETIRIGDVGVRLEGGVRRASVTRAASIAIRGTRGSAEIADLLDGTGLRVNGGVDLELDPLAPGAARGGAGVESPPRIVLEAPEIAGDEETQVALVEEDGELRWLFPGDDRRHFVLDVDDEIGTERGLLGSAIRKAVRFIAVRVAKPAAAVVVESLAAAAESRLRPSRLRTFDDRSFRSDDAPVPQLDELVGEPALLMIHGTNSSTSSAFGRLPTEWVAKLNERYGGRVFAFDHPSISVLPSDNADEFARLLGDHVSPAEPITLDVIAHSRGGLVARELAERPRSGVHVRSVTFVATPNTGTPIASAAHLGSFVDVLTNLAAVIPDNPITDALQIVFELVKDVALELAFDNLPGIAAMTPGGSYLTALNAAPRPDGVAYRAIAADYEPFNTAGSLAKLRDRVTDKVFTGAMNDLVVPTRSVYLRSGEFSVDPRERLVLDSTRSISHSTFWTEPTVLDRFDRWLDGFRAARDVWPPPLPAGSAAESDPHADLESSMARADGPGFAAAVAEFPDRFAESLKQLTGGAVTRPSRPGDPDGDVVVLPGIMGSLIETEEGVVWIDPAKLLRGRFSTLSLERPTHTGTAVGLDLTYAALAARLSERWRVHLFPFDWRLDIDRSADQLDAFIRDTVLADGTRPVHLVAHSMGGLVARRFIQRHRRTWNRIDDAGAHAAGGRLIMLGTPHLGSYSAPLVLAGDDAIVKGLAAVDLRNDRRQIARVIATFPGTYQLLPAASLAIDDDHLRLFDPSAWASADPDPDLLARAQTFQADLVSSHRAEDAERMVTISGDRHRTPGRLVIRNGEHHFGLTDAGDGRVLHASSTLADAAGYFVSANHGGLPADEAVLGAIDELLASGATEQLATTRHPRRGADAAAQTLVRAGAVDPEPAAHSAHRGAAVRRSDAGAVIAESLSGYLGGSLGGSLGGRGVQTDHQLRVRVTHASLEQAEHPVIVGHYRGIPPEGAEGFLDRRLDWALSRRFDADDYPDDAGEALFVEGTALRPPGGIVVGLGDFGELTRSKLVKSIRTAVVQRALAANEAGCCDAIGVSSVLVGSPGDYDLTLAAAMSAIVEGFARAAIEIGKLRGVTIELSELEFVEVYEGRAIQAARHLPGAIASLPIEVTSAIRISGADTLGSGRGGRPGLPASENSGAWPRFVIERKLPPCPPAESDAADDKAYPCGDTVEVPRETLPRLEFSHLGRGAQIDRMSVPFDDDKISALIDAAIVDPQAVDESYALFEMLFPHERKLDLEDADNLQLLVDEDSAYVPWELLYGRGDDRLGSALALRTGLLRQLRPGPGGRPVRRTGRRPEGRRALVIGDPPANGYARLPGAQREARLVRDLLERNGYTVDALIFDDDADVADADQAWLHIQTALYRHPYRIIHFATHGMIDDERPERSGLLVGGDRRLGALDIERMSATPDLVFVNACHTGRTAAGLATARSSQRMNEIASNLALQLMRNGTRAVIAAGWAVDDVAALAFAETTYARLLDGTHYGAAVLAGRRAADDRGRTNTWGAYQCYGDPSFRLRRPTGREHRHHVVSERDLIEQLMLHEQRAADASDISRLRDVQRDVDTLDHHDVARFATTAVFDALGRAYGELGCYADAVWAYRQAITADRGRGQIALRTLEQLANMEVRAAAAQARPLTVRLERTHRIDDDADALIESARESLERLSAFEPTAERLALLGSLAKKDAALNGRRRVSQLNRGRDAYRNAALLALRHGGDLAAYPTCNWIQLSAIRSPDRPGELERQVLRLLEYRRADRSRPLGDHPTLAPEIEAALARRNPEIAATTVAAIDELVSGTGPVEAKPSSAKPMRDFWAESTPGDVALTRMLFGGAEPLPTAESVLSRYLAAFANRSSMRNRDSVIDHIRDLDASIKDDHPARAELAELLRRLIEEAALLDHPPT